MPDGSGPVNTAEGKVLSGAVSSNVLQNVKISILTISSPGKSHRSQACFKLKSNIQFVSCGAEVFAV